MIDPKSYPSIEYVAASNLERGLFALAATLLLVFCGLSIWVASAGETALAVSAFLIFGIVPATLSFVAGLYLRSRRMKRVQERANFLTTIEMVSNG
ncbi:MAG: hypothetical protein WCS75_10490 [Sphingomonas sp.]|uniref:hypothetical protein n=1 Tax=Sphingomonas sp. TaxID=28214 RepID=UPI0035620C17